MTSKSKLRKLARELGSDLLFCAGVALFLTVIFGVYKDGGDLPYGDMALLNLVSASQLPANGKYPAPRATRLARLLEVAGISPSNAKDDVARTGELLESTLLP